MTRDDRSSMMYWFPPIAASGLPVPETIFVTMTEEQMLDLGKAIDGEMPDDLCGPFFAGIAKAAKHLGYPCFLRTAHTSNKHAWDQSCYLDCAAVIPEHVFTIAEFSEICDMIGLPYRHWAVRKYLPVRPIGRCRHYRNMPILREFRFFVDGGTVICWHPYWPADALKIGKPEYFHAAPSYKDICDPGADLPRMTEIAEEAGRVLGGRWSVDLLHTDDGWFLTDMAEADRSWHWPGCPHNRNGETP